MADVDLSQLAVDRSDAGSAGIQVRRHVLTRYLLPAILVFGFAGLILWAARDYLQPPVDVRVVPVLAADTQYQQEGMPLFNAAGWVEPRPTMVHVAALAPGVIERLLVVEDQYVSQGEPIAELIKDDAQLAYERAVANRKLCEADVSMARAELLAAATRREQPVHLDARVAEAAVAVSHTELKLTNYPFELERAESQLRLAESDYRRYLQSGDAVSQKEVDTAQTQVQTLRAMVKEWIDRKASLDQELEANRQFWQALKRERELLSREIQEHEEAQAKVQSMLARAEDARVAVAEAKLRLDRMTIRAPIDGRIYHLVGHPGTRVGMEDKRQEGIDGYTVVTMYQPDRLQIRVDVRFEDIPHVLFNQQVAIDNPALERPLRGTVLYISSEADIQKNTLQVKVGIDMPRDVLKPEMLVDVTFLSPKPEPGQEASETSTRLFVPLSLILDGSEGSFVWVADRASGRAVQQRVTTGALANGGMIAIESGLDVSSRLITTTDGLRPGIRVRISEDNSFDTPGN